MTDPTDAPVYDAVILGGGISGLTAAYDLLRDPERRLSIALLEANAELGGAIRTVRENGCVLDPGPDSFVTYKPWGIELCRELGLEDELIAPNHDTQKIYVGRHGKLHPLPEGFVLGVPTNLRAVLTSRALPWRLKLHMLAEPLLAPRKPHEDESVAQLFYRHFGKQAVELLADPILGGIYASKADRVSVAACFPHFLEMEEKFGSLVRGTKVRMKARAAAATPVFLALKNGMGTLIEALQKHIPDQLIHRGREAQSITFNTQQRLYEVICTNGESWRTKHVIVGLPAVRAKLLFAAMPSVQRSLERFQSVSTVTVALAFDRAKVPGTTDGFGFLIPRSEQSPLLASTWISSKFKGRAPDNVFMLRCFFGGLGQEEIASLSEKELITVARLEIDRWMGVRGDPLFAKVFYWHKQSPQYTVGHTTKVEQLQEALRPHPGLHLIGNAYRGVGIPDSIREARQAASNVLAARPF